MFEDIKNKINELEKELIKLKEDLYNKENEKWYPYCTVGGVACTISCDGSINSVRTSYFQQKELDSIFAMNNIFRTVEEAEFEVERRKVIAEIERMADGVLDGNKACYELAYGDLYDEITPDPYYSTNHGVPIFSSNKKALECIDKIGKERLKKYYFRVKE